MLNILYKRLEGDHRVKHNVSFEAERTKINKTTTYHRQERAFVECRFEADESRQLVFVAPDKAAEMITISFLIALDSFKCTGFYC